MRGYLFYLRPFTSSTTFAPSLLNCIRSNVAYFCLYFASLHLFAYHAITKNTCLSSQYHILVYLCVMYFRLFNCRFYLSRFVVYVVVVVIIIIAGFSFSSCYWFIKHLVNVYSICVWYHNLEWMLGRAVK